MMVGRLLIMPRFLIVFSLVFFSSWSVGQHIQFIDRWDGSTIAANTKYNDCIGYVDSVSGKEYAIIGSLDSIYFFEIQPNGMLLLCDAHAGKDGKAINRDFAIYKHFLYAVADEGNASLQIFDLLGLPGNVKKVYDDSTTSLNAHTCAVEKNRLYLCKNRRGNTIYPMDILSLDTPEKPVRIGSLIAPQVGGKALFEYVHDVEVRNDTAICSCGNDGLYIYNVANAAKPSYISELTSYPEKSFNHSGSFSADSRYFYFTDESQKLGIKVLDLLKVKSPEVTNIFRFGSGGVAHNLYQKDDFLYVSYYHEGVVIYNIKQAKNPVILGRYDTYPQNAIGNYDGLNGCWAVYPWYPSGYFIASDTRNGLYVLKADSNISISPPETQTSIFLYPNPAADELNIQYIIKDANAQCIIISSTGQIVLQQKATTEINLRNMASGIYVFQLIDGVKVYTAKFIKQ
jgi:choice-of-anchor B domain-containing protein